MKVLLLGIGMQGKAALHDLFQNPDAIQIIAADQDSQSMVDHIQKMGYGDKVQCKYLDAADPESLERLLALGPDVAIDLLPVPFASQVARLAVKHGVHLVNTSYLTPEINDLSPEAVQQGVTILPEFGLDPGIDLALAGEAVRALDEVNELASYGAGLPEPEAADNAIRYKVTWTFAGVLQSYYRSARLIRGGEHIVVEPGEIFAPKNVHEVVIDGLGRLEAFPNGDALAFIKPLGLDREQLHHMGRYTLRWPGHCAFWKTIADLHLLDDQPVVVDVQPVDRKRFLAAAIEPHIQLGDQERDIALVRIEASGVTDGKRARAIYQVLDRRDLESGFTGMNRTVGYTASIGAWMIASGTIAKRGVLSPINDIPYAALVRELRKRGIQVNASLTFLE